MSSESPNRQQAHRSTSQESNGGRRKRESRAGTRSVSMLSPAQLERKRANDREAQRTIRQRNREHIESLERQVAELTGQKEQLDEALQHNAVLEAEIERLKQQLAAATPQLQYSNPTTFHRQPEHVSGPSQTPMQNDMMINQRSYSPMSQTSTGVGSERHVEASVGMPMAPSWQSYMMTPESSNCDDFASTGYDYFDSFTSDSSLKQDSMQQTLHGRLLPSNGRGQLLPNSSGMLYHDHMHHQHHQHPHT